MRYIYKNRYRDTSNEGVWAGRERQAKNGGAAIYGYRENCQLSPQDFTRFDEKPAILAVSLMGSGPEKTFKKIAKLLRATIASQDAILATYEYSGREA